MALEYASLAGGEGYCKIWTSGDADNRIIDQAVDPVSAECWLTAPPCHSQTCMELRNRHDEASNIQSLTDKDKMRLVLCQTQGGDFNVFNQPPFTRDYFRRIFGILFYPGTLPQVLDLCENKPYFVKFSTERSDVFALITSGQAREKYGLVASYNHKKGLTRGIIHCQDFTCIVKLLRKSVNLSSHPIRVALLLSRIVMDNTVGQINQHSRRLTEDIEVATGQNYYKFGQRVNRLTIDYAKVTWKTNMLLTDLEWTKIKAKYLCYMYSRLKEMDLQDKSITNILEHQHSICQNLLVILENIRERAKNELEVAYNFNAQRDNSVITAIGIITFVFFPGTFIASIFAMPLIAWDVDEDERKTRLNPDFWLFPVVTISFTAAIVIVLCPWIWKTNRVPREWD